MILNGSKINFSTVAMEAQVSRMWLYRHQGSLVKYNNAKTFLKNQKKKPENKVTWLNLKHYKTEL